MTLAEEKNAVGTAPVTPLSLPLWRCPRCGLEKHHHRSFAQLLRGLPRTLMETPWYAWPMALVFIPFLLPFEWWERERPTCWWCIKRTRSERCR